MPQPSRPATYVPEPYDPRLADSPAKAMASGYGYGIVHPGRRAGRSGWVALAVVVLLAGGFLAWRVTSGGGHRAAAASSVTYNSALGHFSASFPAQPVEQVTRQRYGPVRLTLHVVSAPAARTVVEEADIAPALPVANDSAASARLLSGVLSGVSESGQLTQLKKHAVVFQGHPAQQAEYADLDGTMITALAAAYGPRRLYVLAAPSGKPFEALRQSFQGQSG